MGSVGGLFQSTGKFGAGGALVGAAFDHSEFAPLLRRGLGRGRAGNRRGRVDQVGPLGFRLGLYAVLLPTRLKGFFPD
jgi:hypothetical protein